MPSDKATSDYRSSPEGIEHARRYQAELEQNHADREGIKVRGLIAEAEHNKHLAETVPLGWSISARYAEFQNEETGWFYFWDSRIYEISAPDGSSGVFELRGEEVKHPTGWTVTSRYSGLCYIYNITSPSGDEMEFVNGWNA